MAILWIGRFLVPLLVYSIRFPPSTFIENSKKFQPPRLHITPSAFIYFTPFATPPRLFPPSRLHIKEVRVLSILLRFSEFWVCIGFAYVKDL